MSNHGGDTAKTESLDFHEIESMAWKKHQSRRFHQERGLCLNFTSHKAKDIKTWALIIITGSFIACTGAVVILLTFNLYDWKFQQFQQQLNLKNTAPIFFKFILYNLFFAALAGLLCMLSPPAEGSGIPELRAFLNGVKIENFLRFSVLIAKVIGMSLSVASGLPLGKEGPMIHVGSIIGGIISQGLPFSCGYDIRWANFQDFRNDVTKRDFITIGAAAGVAAAFRAPIGGILFTLEEGASFWSLPITISAFICAAISQLTTSLIFADVSGGSQGTFAFGQFDTLVDGRNNYYIYELVIFILIGALGGLVGALYNHINFRMTLYRKKVLNGVLWKRFLELLALTLLMSLVSFILPLMWQVCTPVPSETFTQQEAYLAKQLVQMQCKEGEYNELASLYLTTSDIAMQQLFHFRELDNFGHSSLGFIPLLLFLVPYFFLAAITPGILAPAGLFIPTLFTGAAMGRM